MLLVTGKCLDSYKEFFFSIAILALINVPLIQNVKTITPICLFSVPICPRGSQAFEMSLIKATAKGNEFI